MKTILKILFGILAFIVGGIITALVITPLLNILFPNEIFLNVMHLFFNVGIAVIIYRITIRLFLIKKK